MYNSAWFGQRAQSRGNEANYGSCECYCLNAENYKLISVFKLDSHSREMISVSGKQYDLAKFVFTFKNYYYLSMKQWNQ